MVVGSRTSSRISFVGRGVVVTTHLGLSPRRMPNISMSQASGYRRLPISSHHAASACGPRRRSGSSAEKVVAVAPLGQVSRRFEGSYWGQSHGGEIARMPDSPSTITSRASAAVGATNAKRRRPALTSDLIHSAPHRVLPKPRPASSIHTRHDPAGGSWLGRAQNPSQSWGSLRSRSGDNPERMRSRSAFGASANRSAREAFSDLVELGRNPLSGIRHLNRLTARATHLDRAALPKFFRPTGFEQQGQHGVRVTPDRNGIAVIVSNDLAGTDERLLHTVDRTPPTSLSEAL